MLLEAIALEEGDMLRAADFQDTFGHGITGSGIEIRYDDKGQKYLWLFAREDGPYDDDIGEDRFVYVGEDPQGPSVDEPGNEDQEMARGNAALREAIDTPLPIFLFFQPTDAAEWEFRGLVKIVSFEYKPRDGRHVYEFTLEPRDVLGTGHAGGGRAPHDLDDEERVPDVPQPTRTETTRSRVVRNTDFVRKLKQLYECRCQVCGDRRERSDGGYAEGHHLQPLGAPHHGPDVEENILILCPNHHADFDYGTISVEPQTYELTHAYEDAIDGSALTVEQEHALKKRYLQYHNQRLTQF